MTDAHVLFFFFKYVEVSYLVLKVKLFHEQVLAATQTSGETGMNWFQGTADAVRQFIWVFEVSMRFSDIYHVLISP